MINFMLMKSTFTVIDYVENSDWNKSRLLDDYVYLLLPGSVADYADAEY